MKLTNQQLLEHYLKDLQTIDTTHDYRPKNAHPEYWNIPSLVKNEAIVLDPYNTTRDIWFWSDPHFFHKNIIRYSKRPFPNIDLMNQCLIGNALNVIKPGDILIWGGDICFGHHEEVRMMIQQIPAYHIHIIGNHDMDNRGTKVFDFGMDERHSCLTIDIDEYQLLITHYPLTDCPPNCINIHGHIHQHQLEWYNFNICVEHTNYSPINIKTIINYTKEQLQKYQ